MAYYIYKISPGATDFFKNLSLITEFESFKDAKNHAKSLRMEIPENSGDIIKVIFANSELDAEEKLSEKRDKPIVREWEK